MMKDNEKMWGCLGLPSWVPSREHRTRYVLYGLLCIQFVELADAGSCATILTDYFFVSERKAHKAHTSSPFFSDVSENPTAEP